MRLIERIKAACRVLVGGEIPHLVHIKLGSDDKLLFATSLSLSQHQRDQAKADINAWLAGTSPTGMISGLPDLKLFAIHNAQPIFKEEKVGFGQALLDIEAERKRQIEKEGWTPKHDDMHEAGDLAGAGAAYAMSAMAQLEGDPTWIRQTPPGCWPWETKWWKPGTPRRDLVKAAALLLAQIEKIDRDDAYYEELERKHFGDSIKGTGIYANSGKGEPS